MIISKPHNSMKRIYLFLVLFVLAAGTICAQTTKKYDGPMKLPWDLYMLKSFDPRSNSTSATYSYYENADEDRIKHGDFLFVFTAKNFRRELKGKYEHGKKTGTWTVKDIKTLSVTNYAKHMDVSFSFKDDFLDGPLKGTFHSGHEEYVISCSFTKGRLTGQFHVNLVDEWEDGQSYEIDGKIDDNGQPTGIWVFKQKGGIEITQKRLYINGALVYIQEQDLSSGSKTLPYCAFSEVKKAPAVEEITVTSVDGVDCIAFQDYTARLAKIDMTGHGFYPRKDAVERCKLPKIGKLWISELIEFFPESMWRYARSFYDKLDMPEDIWKGPEPLADQRYEWAGYYTNHAR